MIFPNKLYNFDETTLSKLTLILRLLDKSEMSVTEIFRKLKNKFKNIEEFILAVEILYLLDMIYYDSDWGVLRYVKKNIV